MSRRYEMWAGICTDAFMEYLSVLFSDNSQHDIDPPDVKILFPIVDTQTCGPINGSPTPKQWYCLCPTPEAQSLICELLNQHATKV